MMELLLRADDLGYCDAVNCGIEKTVKEGLIRSVGLMVNMPTAVDGLARIAGTGISIGLHTNICLGVPCCDAKEIPSLAAEDGTFKRSSEYRAAYQNGKDLVVLEDAVKEAEAQYLKFKEMTGKEPAYFEAHAIASDNLWKALEIVAEKYHLRLNMQKPGDAEGTFNGHKIHPCRMQSMEKEYDAFQSLQDAVKEADSTMPNVFVCHPGYIDAYLLENSSLTYNRAKEVEMLCSPETKKWLQEQDIKLVSYDEIA